MLFQNRFKGNDLISFVEFGEREDENFNGDENSAFCMRFNHDYQGNDTFFRCGLWKDHNFKKRSVNLSKGVKNGLTQKSLDWSDTDYPQNEDSYDYTDGGIFPMDGVDHSKFDRDNFIVFKRDYYEKHFNGEVGDIGKDERFPMMMAEDQKYLTVNEFNLRAWDATFDTCDPPTGE